MNAEQVVQKILAEANAEAEKIISDAKAKVAEKGAHLDAEIAEFDMKSEGFAKEAAEDKFQRVLANARMTNAKQVLTAKVAILDEVFDKAKTTINQLPDDQYLLLMTTLLKKAIETGDEEVIIGKNETRIDDKFISQFNKQLSSGGTKSNLRLSAERAGIAGGFILSRGKVQVNASTDVMMDTLRESMSIELAEELFTDEKNNE